MKVAIYARVSTDRQEKQESIETQLVRCREYCEREGYEVVRVFEDNGVSGALLMEERPNGAQLIEGATAKQFERVVTYDLSRISREEYPFYSAEYLLRKLKVAIEYLDVEYEDSPTGHAQKGVSVVFAAWERRGIRKKTMDGRRRKAEEGEYPSPQAPYGWDIDKSSGRRLLVINENEARVVRRIFQMSIDGYGIALIARALNDDGVVEPVNPRKTQKHFGWKPDTVDRIIKARRYVGELTYSDADIPVDCPAIVDEETFQLANDGLRDRKAKSRRNTKGQYLLQHLIRCRACGYMFRAKPEPNGTLFYRCSKRGDSKTYPGHEGVRSSLKASEIEPLIKDFVAWTYAEPERLFSDVNAQIEQSRSVVESVNQQVRELERRLKKLEDGEARVVRQLRNELISERIFRQEQQAIANDRKELERQLAQAKEDASADGVRTQRDFLTMLEGLKGKGLKGRRVVTARMGKKLIRPQIEFDPETHKPRYTFVDLHDPEPEEPTFDEWRVWIQELISCIWVGEDEIIIEGPGQTRIGTVTLEHASR